MPATTANLGPGFDTLGMALALYNTVELETNHDRLEIDIIGEGSEGLPRDESNVVWQAACEMFRRAGVKPPRAKLRLNNRIPSARGLGSSAAARIGGILAANALMDGRFSIDEMLEAASQLEGHPDNVAAALLGGIVVCATVGGRVVWRKLPVPSGLLAVAAVPSFELSTSLACSVLPSEVRMRDAVANLSRSCLLVLALAEGRLEMLGELMEDRLHQPYREKLIPGLQEVFAEAKRSGALGVALSGAGPTVLALTRDRSEAVGAAMREAFARSGVVCDIIELRPVEDGAGITEI